MQKLIISENKFFEFLDSLLSTGVQFKAEHNEQEGTVIIHFIK